LAYSLAKLVGRLKREDQANKNRDQGKDRQGADTGFHGLRDGALEAQLLSLKGSH